MPRGPHAFWSLVVAAAVLCVLGLKSRDVRDVHLTLSTSRPFDDAAYYFYVPRPVPGASQRQAASLNRVKKMNVSDVYFDPSRSLNPANSLAGLYRGDIDFEQQPLPPARLPEDVLERMRADAVRPSRAGGRAGAGETASAAAATDTPDYPAVFGGVGTSPPRFASPLGADAELRVVNGRNTTLTDYLTHHFPLTHHSFLHGTRLLPLDAQPHLWLTLSDVRWLQTGTRALHTFVSRLNAERREKYGAVRPTVVVVMCMDAACLAECSARRYFCYGGFRFNKPKLLLDSTWPKVGALAEALATGRDVFFVDSDVNFKYDPYPAMAQHMNTSDLVISENGAFDHSNTGWFWIRSMAESVDAWAQVIEMDKKAVSRDQYNFNTVLDTTKRRKNPRTKSGHPLRSDFVAANGMRVHILDDAQFLVYHYFFDRPDISMNEALYLHITCGDDYLNRVFVAKAHGFYPDVDGYYSHPPPILQIEAMAGKEREMTQLVKVLAVAAYYTGRTLEPADLVSFTDIDTTLPGSTSLSGLRRSYTAFPYPQIAHDLNVSIVEPHYTEHAIQYLTGTSVLARGTRRREGLKDDAPFPPADVVAHSIANGTDAAATILALSSPVELDMRLLPSVEHFIDRLLSPSFVDAPVIRLVNVYDLNWYHWNLPRVVDGIHACRSLHKYPLCSQLCRFSADDGKYTIHAPAPWPRMKIVNETEEAAVDSIDGEFDEEEVEEEGARLE